MAKIISVCNFNKDNDHETVVAENITKKRRHKKKAKSVEEEIIIPHENELIHEQELVVQLQNPISKFFQRIISWRPW